jgi:antitoxin (DNA-binding transcriptional repressor) of toxin-antitoxin stability system
MTTITATYLRNHLDDVMSQVVQGKEFMVSHRFKGVMKLSRATEESKRKPMEGLKAIIKLQEEGKIKFDFDVNRPLKELYAESMAEKYGIK